MTAAFTGGTVDVKGGSAPLNADEVHFTGPTAYPAGGITGFTAVMRALLGRGAVEILGVVPNECGGYVPVWDRANDKLKIYFGDNNNAADGPLIENTTADLSLVTFNLLVFSR